MRNYGIALSAIATLIFFGNVDLYLFVVEYWGVTPRDWVTLFCLLALPLCFRTKVGDGVVRAVTHPLTIWSLCYLAISAAWLVWAPSDVSLQEFRDRALTCIFLGMTSLIFAEPGARRAAGASVTVAFLATLAINAIQLVDPTYFFVPVPARASGLYGNANQCGAAAVIAMILIMPGFGGTMRLVLATLSGTGVLMSLSRSAIIGWVIAIATGARGTGEAARAVRMRVGSLVIAGLAVSALGALYAVSTMDWSMLDTDQQQRLTFIQTFDMSDHAAQERVAVAAHAWNMFVESPILGHGLGSTLVWSERVSTHNMYLFFLADHGVLGFFIVPALLFLVWRAGKQAPGHGHAAFCLFTAWQALFSHNVLDERYYLLAFSLLIAGGVPERAPSAASVRLPRAVAPPPIILASSR